MNITEPIRRIARDRPDAVALIRRDGVAMSFRELDGAIDHAAHALAHAGVKAGDVVMVILDGPYKVVVLQAALARMGAAASTPTLPPQYAAASLIDWATQSALHPRPIVVDDRWFDRTAIAASAPYPMHAGDDAVAIVIQSSGTTGDQKNIALSHRLFAARHAAQAHRLPLPDDLRQICVRRPSSSYGFSVRMRAWSAGGTVVHATTADQVIAMADRHRVTRLVAPPFMLDQIAALRTARNGPIASLAQIEVGGSFMPEPLYIKACERVCPVIYGNYGVTEAGFVAGGPMASFDRSAGEVGRVAPGIHVEALDPDGRVLPPGETGVLRVKCDQAASAYVDAPEASRTTFRDGWIYTGDVGRVGADGSLVLAGRESEQINVGGWKISPLPIERALLSLDAVADAAAFGVNGANGITMLAAAVVARSPIDRQALADAMRTHSPNAAPTFVLQVDAIPRNEAGKVLRRELAALAAARGASEA